MLLKDTGYGLHINDSPVVGLRKHQSCFLPVLRLLTADGHQTFCAHSHIFYQILGLVFRPLL